MCVDWMEFGGRVVRAPNPRIKPSAIAMIDTYPASALVLRLAILDVKEPVPEAQTLSPLHWGDKAPQQDHGPEPEDDPSEHAPYVCSRCASWE